MVCAVKTGMSSLNGENWKEMLKRRCCKREEVRSAKIMKLLWKYSLIQVKYAVRRLKIAREYGRESTPTSTPFPVGIGFFPRDESVNLTKLPSVLVKKAVQKHAQPLQFKFY
jgi:hypothetical protein